MLRRIATEYRELFDAFIAPRLHPRDIVALGTCMRALRRHCMYTHAVAFVRVLAQIRAMQYCIFPDTYYSRRSLRPRYAIVHGTHDSHGVSVRDRVMYIYKFGELANYGLIAAYTCGQRMHYHFVYENSLLHRVSIGMYDNRTYSMDILAWYTRHIAASIVLGKCHNTIRHYLDARDLCALESTCRPLRGYINYFNTYTLG